MKRPILLSFNLSGAIYAQQPPAFNTPLVADVPSEAQSSPKLWGPFELITP